MLISVIGEFEI